MQSRPFAILALSIAILVGLSSTSSIGSAAKLAGAQDIYGSTPYPQLEPGFPVRVSQTRGSNHAGPGISTLVGNIDADPTLEIVVSAQLRGPLYAWNADGSPQPGWPLNEDRGYGY